MEVAKYILKILRTQTIIVWSWGFNSPVTIANGLKFNVQGFKFKGSVEVLYNEGKDLFEVSFIKNGKVIEAVNDVFFDMLVEVIDEHVEKTDDYEERVKAEYSL